MLVELDNYSALYYDKQIVLFDIKIPDGLVNDIKIPKENILKYHTEPKKVIKVRNIPTKERLEKEIKKLQKELKGKK